MGSLRNHRHLEHTALQKHESWITVPKDQAEINWNLSLQTNLYYTSISYNSTCISVVIITFSIIFHYVQDCSKLCSLTFFNRFLDPSCNLFPLDIHLLRQRIFLIRRYHINCDQKRKETIIRGCILIGNAVCNSAGNEI